MIITGTNLNDTLFGTLSSDQLIGSAGNDILNGGGFILNSGVGLDTANYSSIGTAVILGAFGLVY